MAYILQIDASPMGDNSVSRKLAASYAQAYTKAHPGVQVKHRDLTTSPVPHLDAEAISAAYVPEDKRPASQQAKHQFRLDLIKEITGAQAIVIASPMWNWNIPSVLKAYIDQIILVGSLDVYGAQGLTGKPVTILVATGGGGYGDEKANTDFVSNYLKHSTLNMLYIYIYILYILFVFATFTNVLFTFTCTVATSLGSSDVEVIRSELTLAGIVPGMEGLVPAKEKSFAEATAAAVARALI